MSDIRLLWQCQLSNYDSHGKFNLVGDSNWQLVVTKLPHMFKVNPNMSVTVLAPRAKDCLERPIELLREACAPEILDKVKVIEIPIIPSALKTRFDFPWDEMVKTVPREEYTHVYINDPMLYRHWRALAHLEWNLAPKFIVQTHFLDTPKDPVVPPEVAYWYGTVEAVQRADVAMWHSDAMRRQFTTAMRGKFSKRAVKEVIAKSIVWKSGYSTTEIHKPVDMSRVRFDPDVLKGKMVVWVPNRVGGLGRSLDYTNAGKFLFEQVPKLWQRRQDFVVVAGNPSAKISNDEIANACPAYVKLVDGPLNRDEYRWLSARADLVVALYLLDANGGLAALEAIDHHAMPIFPNVNEYKTYFTAADWECSMRVWPNLNNTHEVVGNMIDGIKNGLIKAHAKRMRNFVRSYASYESTTAQAMKDMGLA